MYNINANNDKNEVAQKTAEFIDERIGIISKELGSTEQDLENFKRTAGITDLSSEAQIALTGNAEYEKKRVENQTQINLIVDLQNTFRVMNMKCYLPMLACRMVAWLEQSLVIMRC